MNRKRSRTQFSARHAWPMLLLSGSLTASLAYGADAPAPPAIDPSAMNALKVMGEHLRELKSFTVHADTLTDDVSADGQKLQYTGTVDYRVRRPDHLRAEVNSDRRQRSFYYDGKTLTQYAPRVGYYASFSAPPTIGETLGVLQDKYGISMPLVDLFLWGTRDGDGSAITSARYVGPATVAGAECDHYAYRQPDADWQVWIGSETHFPCKLVITTTDEPSQPQYIASFTWHPAAKFEDKDFTFVAPKTAHKIEIATVDTSAE